LLSCIADSVDLLDLPDELILAIINKIDGYHSIDLPFDYSDSPRDELVLLFLSYLIPRILNNIQSMTINVRHLTSLDRISKKVDDEHFSMKIYYRTFNITISYRYTRN